MYAGWFGQYLYFCLWLFLIYSVYGVIVEMIFCYAREYKGVVESRCGLLYLPLSPIYGFGGVVVSLILLPHLANPLLIFGLSIVVCTTLEYIASFVMEKAFKSVFWDYSNKPLNLHGRICLEFALYWGVLGVFLIYILDTFTYVVVDSWARPAAEVVLTVFVAITLASVTLTLMAFRRLDLKLAALRAQRDGEPVPDIDTGWGRLIDKVVPDVVLINTFPRMSQVLEYMTLTGKPRKLVIWDLHLGTPSPRHLELRRLAAAHQIG